MPRLKPVTSTPTPPPPKPRLPIGKLPPSPLAHCFRHITNPDTGDPEWRYYMIWVEAAANDGDTKMADLLTHYLAMPRREQATIMPEQLCDLAHVQPHELMAAVAGQLFKYSRQETLLIAAIQQPQVVDAVASRAKSAEGASDAAIFLKGTGYLPQSKGSTFFIGQAHAPELREPILVGSGSSPTLNRLGAPQSLIPAGRRVLELDALEREDEIEVDSDDADTDGE